MKDRNGTEIIVREADFVDIELDLPIIRYDILGKDTRNGGKDVQYGLTVTKTRPDGSHRKIAIDTLLHDMGKDGVEPNEKAIPFIYGHSQPLQRYIKVTQDGEIEVVQNATQSNN